MRNLFSSRRGQATTETVLLFPIIIIFTLFILKIFAILVLTQKMEIAGFYAARRYQLQSHLAGQGKSWDKRFLEKDIQDKVEEYLGFRNPGIRRFLSLRKLTIKVDLKSTWIKITLTAFTQPPRIKFLCKYDKLQICENTISCLKGYAFLCEEGGEIKVIKYVGYNDRVLPYISEGT